jgi:drug/metabolite transporter (DMT)-like permease
MPIVLGGGLGQIGASLILMNIALPFLPAGRTALLAYTTPIWVAGLQAVVFRARPSKREAIALVLGLGGIGLLINPASIDWRAPGVLVGSGIMLMSAALMGGTILLLRHHRWEGPTLDLIFWETLVALVPLGLLAVAFDAGKPVNWGVQALFCVLYSGALESAFGYWASQTIQRALPAMATSVILLAVPIVGIFTGAVVLGETISLGDLIGFAVTLTGIVTLSLLASNGQGRHPPKAPAEPVPGNSPASTTP